MIAIRRVCAWCNRPLDGWLARWRYALLRRRGSAVRVSHGICRACERQHFGAIQ